MEECCDFIDKYYPAGAQPADEPSSEKNSTPSAPQGSVLVHCTMGISRSPTIVIAYLMRKHRKPYKKVLAEVRKQRSVVSPKSNFVIQLNIWERTGYQIWEDEAKTIPKAEYKEYLERREAYLKSEEDQGRIVLKMKSPSRYDRKPGVK
jgi:dual specificity phosphatase 12